MKRTGLLTLYWHNMKNEIARSMQFRADFAVGLVSSFLYSFMSAFLQFLLFSLTRGYPGWTVEQMLLFQGVFMLWTGLRETLFGRVRELMTRIMWKGEFDQILLKPFHAGGYLLTSGFDFSKVSSIVAGIAVIVLSFPGTGSLLTGWGILGFLAVLTSGVVFYMAILLMFCALTLVIINTGRFIDLIERLMDFAAFPSDLYPLAGRLIFDFIIPFAVFICFPARAILGRFDWVMAGGAAVSVFFFLASLLFWRLSLRRYTSAGG